MNFKLGESKLGRESVLAPSYKIRPDTIGSRELSRASSPHIIIAGELWKKLGSSLSASQAKLYQDSLPGSIIIRIVDNSYMQRIKGYDQKGPDRYGVFFRLKGWELIKELDE